MIPLFPLLFLVCCLCYVSNVLFVLLSCVLFVLLSLMVELCSKVFVFWVREAF